MKFNHHILEGKDYFSFKCGKTEFYVTNASNLCTKDAWKQLCMGQTLDTDLSDFFGIESDGVSVTFSLYGSNNLGEEHLMNITFPFDDCKGALEEAFHAIYGHPYLQEPISS